MLKEIAKYHKEWIKVAKAFLNNKEDAEDLVQDMYIKISSYDVIYDDRFEGGLNKMYVYMTIRNLALDSIKRRKPDLTYVDYIEQLDTDDEVLDEYKYVLADIDNEISKWNWYDRTLFEMYMYSGLSMRDIAYGTNKDPRWLSGERKICSHSIINGTGISLSSIYNTIKRCKERIKMNVTPNTKK